MDFVLFRFHEARWEGSPDNSGMEISKLFDKTKHNIDS